MIVGHEAHHKIIISGNWTLYKVAQPKTNTKAMILWIGSLINERSQEVEGLRSEMKPLLKFKWS